MASNEVTRSELTEIIRRLDGVNAEQNRRLDNIDRICENVAELAATMKLMLSEQTKTSERVGALEKADSMKWRYLVQSAISALVGGVVAFVMMKLGFV